MDDLSQPHPSLSDPRVRQAIAHCIDRDALISSVYTYVPDDVKASLRMDSFLPKDHWAYSGPYQDYEYSVEQGGALLDEAGWTWPEDSAYRVNADGDALELTLTTTNAQFRQTWAAVVEQQLGECGILLIRQHTPASWWFGDTTGLARRDFELGAFAWVGQADPGGRTLYACDQIPTPSNNWEGQNGMGWCNPLASQNIIIATNTLERDARIAAYNIVQEEFAKDMVSLPLFQRAEAEAWSLNLEGLVTDPTEYGTASAANWTLTDGGDTIVLGFSQEPASMFTLVESAAVQRQIAQMGIGVATTQYSYDYQAVLQEELSTIESGLATNELVPVTAGDIVYGADGSPVELAEGVEVLVDGEVVAYDGTSELELPQLVVTYKFKPYTWSDGTPGSIDDFRLGIQIKCDRQSGATTFNGCETFGTEEDVLSNVTFSDSALEYTIKYWPGVQDPGYYVAPFSLTDEPVYPSHRVLSDGRNLRDVPAVEWTTLPEIAESPLSFGPFMITEWIKGQSLTLEANPYYEGGTGAQKIIVLFIPDTNQAVAQLLSGDVDYVEKATLAGGAEVQLVADAAEQGTVNFEIIPSPTWEHIDMNLFVKEK
ncbi:MAG: peptide ABC transporter substrate-binding protein [Caldilineaceae bacterium]|nr:peptide ABC transporter substrate-binding protein [Caldilineaceae bacterium]